MTDRELLELAAKAAGIVQTGYVSEGQYHHAALLYNNEDDCSVRWNPLIDDGDALRLAVHLELETYTGRDDSGKAEQYVGYSPAGQRIRYVYEPHGNDPYAATRRAIVRAAAEIGKQK